MVVIFSGKLYLKVEAGWVFLWPEETSAYTWSRFYTENYGPPVSNYQPSHIRFANLRGGRRVCFHCATAAPLKCDVLQPLMNSVSDELEESCTKDPRLSVR